MDNISVIDSSEMGGSFEIPPAPEKSKEPEELSFKGLVKSFLKGVNDRQSQADQDIKDFLAGNLQNTHTMSIHIKEATISLELAIQVRNAFMAGLQEVQRMSV